MGVQTIFFQKPCVFRMLTRIFVIVFLVTGQPELIESRCFAGGGPENAVVVVNNASESSKLIANHYVALRKIPWRNVIYLDGIPDRETTNFETFKNKILLPILLQLKIRNIQQSVDYILYSADFPTDIRIVGHQKLLLKQIRASTAGADGTNVPIKRLYAAHASINSLTYFMVAALSNQPRYMALDSNSYYRVPASEIVRFPFNGQQQEEYLAATKAFEKGPGKEFDEAIVSLQRLALSNPGQAAVSYWLAKFYATRGDVKASVKWLTQAVQNGWVYQSETKKDKAFEPIRFNPLFRGIEDRIPDDPFTFAPTRGFKHLRRWAFNGMVNGENGQGNNFLLSTVLAVTRNFGTTEQEAIDQLTASASADGSNPNGTFYFSLGKGVRNSTRKSQIKSVVDTLKSMGKDAKTIESNLPKNTQNVMGLLTGTAKFDFRLSGNRIVPGAICEHLTSFGGRLAVPNQTKLSEFIRHGAAGASGTVTEPFSIAAKFPHAMMHVHYARGCSLAESFYQSVAGPYQLLIVGDALCQPFAIPPKVTVDGLAPMQEVGGKISLKFDISASKVPVSMMEMYVDGVLFFRDHELKPLDFDTKLVSDGFHEMRVVVTSNDLIEANSHRIIPFVVNNAGHSIRAAFDRTKWSDAEDVSIEVTSNFGDSVVVVHNMRPVVSAKKMTDSKRPLRFTFPAKNLGRGPVTLFAVAQDEKKIHSVTSKPIHLQIDGIVSKSRRNTERPKAKLPKSTPTTANATGDWTPR